MRTFRLEPTSKFVEPTKGAHHMTTGLVFHERYLWHDTGQGWIIPNDGVVLQPYEHPENPETKRRMLNLWRASGALDHLTPIKPRPACVDEVLRVHTRDYHDRIVQTSAAGGGDAGGLTPFGLGSYEIAMLSAGGCIAAVDAVLDGVVDNVYALVRPPGHHAIPDSGLGFCIFNNASIAVKHLREARGVARVAVIDWDVHHGNGQQAVFYDDPSVLTISIHQDLCFPPDSGYITDRGSGAGEGFNINLPLPPGSGHGAYLAAYERVVVEALHRFRPDFIVAPSGFDGGMFDPLGRMMAWSETFREMTRMLRGAADELCGGRLVLTHEGGYSQAYVPFIGLAVIEELSGVRTGVDDPYRFICEHGGQQALQPHQNMVIAQAAELACSIPVTGT
jgi:acetoin utilization deacetylase AcuC-like enzyme